MVERFCSKNYDKCLVAVCDDLSLPFWGIYGDYTDDNAIPFIYIYDSMPRLILGEVGWAHIDIINTKLNGKSYKDKALNGRLWIFNKKKILTLWAEDAPAELLNHTHINNLADLFKQNKITISNAELVFEANSNNTVKGWFDKTDFIYIYAISVDEYIRKSMTSFADVIKDYQIQQKKSNYCGSSINRKEWQQFDDGSGNAYLGYHLMTRMDENKKNINEGILAEKLPDDIMDALNRKSTSIGNNPAIPDIYDIPFLLKIAQKRFIDTKETLQNIGTIDDFEDTNITSMLSKLIKKCKDIEKPFRNELEKICFNLVIDLFDVPDETVQLEIELVDKVDLGRNSIILDPIDGDGNDDIEYDSVNDAKNIMGEIYKRRLLNALCMGQAITLSSNIDFYKKEIERLSPELCDLYSKIIALNNYSLFTKENIGMTDKDTKQIGTFELYLGNEDEQPKIKAQGEIFPVLLNETIRGFLELFISHGLPSDKKTAMYVVGKSDFLKAEPWDMRLGPSLWTLFSDSFNDLTINELPYLLKNVSSLDTDKFNFLMKEVFAKTKKGKNIMSKLCGKAKNEIQYDKFTDKMSKMRTDKSMITDEYIGVNEL